MWVLLATLIWHSTGSPVFEPIQPVNLNANTCVSLANSLFSNVTGALAVDELFKGMNCTEQSMELNVRTQTLAVCAPQNTTCSGHKFTFDREACLLNILKDLRFYRTALMSHPRYDLILGPMVLKSITHFMQDCFSLPFAAQTPMVSTHPDNTFDERLRLCRTLRGFRTRTITISRVIRYILNKD
ncbi:interleukin-12 subunit alpha-like [Alosa pseudoharengus]|uniref:interleukin-12 subunit alpha-like n=1 Tax=Alosa pseudoharengus TaxID=34774 RepID=UPI003F8AF082